MDNPLAILENDIEALAERERRWPVLVQIPRKRARKLMKLTAGKWAEFSRGLMSEKEIEERTQGAFYPDGEAALSGLYVGGTRIKVASGVGDDCGELVVLEWRPAKSA
jgi:hypothetical protein